MTKQFTTTCISEDVIEAFRQYLVSEEKSSFTIEKYLRDVKRFAKFHSGELTKEAVLEYKTHLTNSGKYTDSSINSMLASIRSFLIFIGRSDCVVKNLTVQDVQYNPEVKCLKVSEFTALLEIAKKSDRRLYLILLVMFSTGIRISELKYFTVESFKKDLNNISVSVRCKKKSRIVIVVDKLRKLIMDYIKDRGITSGPIFCTRNGKPLDRSYIWRQLKKLSKKANVQSSKVFPHNLRKLFARIYFEETHDIARLSSILGHSSINTTKLYVKDTEEHARQQINDAINKYLIVAEEESTLSA